MVNPRQRVSKRFFGWLSLLLLSVLVGIVPQATVSAAPLCSSVASSGTKPAPVGNISTWPKWRQIFIDNFDRCSLGGDWGPYYGAPGGNSASWWDPSMVRLDGGKLQLRAQQVDGRWLTGGVSNFTRAQQYGKWEMRFRADKSDEISFHLLLWPKNEIWPPEIDIAETVDGNRKSMSAFVHWNTPTDGFGQGQADITGDFSNWNTVGVEWGPGIVRGTLNGRVWTTFESATKVPATPMWLGLQTESGGACARKVAWGGVGGSCPSAGTPAVSNVEIDWVSVYAPGW